MRLNPATDASYSILSAMLDSLHVGISVPLPHEPFFGLYVLQSWIPTVCIRPQSTVKHYVITTFLDHDSQQ